MSIINNSVELGETLKNLLSEPKLSRKLILELHDQMERTLIMANNEAIIDRHPGWILCEGHRAAELYLCRNWRRSVKLGDEKERLQVLAEQMKKDFFAAQNERVDLELVEKIMRDLDEQDHFTEKVLGNGLLLILSAGCAHRRFSALCRPYIYQDDSFSCDVYLFQRTVEDRSTSWGSILLHELGHILNLRLTGDISVVPDDFLSFAEWFFPDLSTKYRASARSFSPTALRWVSPAGRAWNAMTRFPIFRRSASNCLTYICGQKSPDYKKIHTNKHIFAKPVIGFRPVTGFCFLSEHRIRHLTFMLISNIKCAWK